MSSTLEKKYRDKIVSQLKKELAFKSAMEVPRISKITLNMGVGDAAEDKKIIANAVDDLTRISGQKPITTITKKAIAGFKIRENWPIGCKVTLRKKRMYDFLERLISIAIPRIRDFRGFSAKSFDGRGNYSLGIKEQIVFPEIEYDKIDKIRGLDVTITTTAKTDAEARALLKAYGFPLKD
ncbi:MAG: 50S ribosomal protein L5 [uncultured bacterium]|nr:MAG: 50S ribosomal protein L5 [uncultured bacterium]OGT37163.1 MAG: 50S ribosomal protein L5 [Gammaproteobacteria bacterium RIFCSPHIGHO2_12_FULL_38_14]